MTYLKLALKKSRGKSRNACHAIYVGDSSDVNVMAWNCAGTGISLQVRAMKTASRTRPPSRRLEKEKSLEAEKPSTERCLVSLISELRRGCHIEGRSVDNTGRPFFLLTNLVISR
jgi:hypothetical protein